MAHTFPEQQLKELGFRPVEDQERLILQYDFLYEPENQIYQLFIPIESDKNGQEVIRFDEPDIAGSGGVALEVRQAAIDKLKELQHTYELATVQNGAMAQTEQEMKRLGAEMDHMPTNSELLEDDIIPDPRQ